MVENRGPRQTVEASALQGRPLKEIPGTRAWLKALKEKER